MDTPRKGRLARAFAKVVHIRAMAGAPLENGVQKKTNKKAGVSDKTGDDDLLERRAREAFLAKVFASISTVKASYAQLQFAQCPYDSEGIQTADQAIVSELKSVSELKQAYLKNNLNNDKASSDMTLLLSEIQEQKSLLKTYEVTRKKLDSELRLKDSEITFLKEKLAEAVSENQLLERRVNSSGQLSTPDIARISDLTPTRFVACYKLAVKSIRIFVRLLVTEIEESAGWDLEAIASLIVPGTPFWKSSHICFAFESFVCRNMFEGFSFPDGPTQTTSSPPECAELRHLFFNQFMEMRSVRPGDYLAWKPRSTFAKFCRDKYLRLVHPKMELSIFGNLDQRKLVSSGETPETPFFNVFTEMAKAVWLLHCLAISFEPKVEIFQVSKGSRFSEVYMESLSDEAFAASDGSPGSDPQVAFVVVPGFRIGTIVVQCQVYLR